ncbi:MlaD family protein [Mucisphaera calidilacus]|uniref:Mce related protein n=1 Tax=Mucisphaera calidilacus TaxID=2527982 RepID=A0A518BZ07_9BACT|nr:MlaD family protein [Mucisphaera calidilacus]QDU72212.1 mce related protein [Mucisphaera calidilacus]
MAEEASQRNIAVGLTAAAGIGGLVALLMLFGYIPAFLDTGYAYQIQLKDSGGLYADSRVTYYGIDIGKVTSVEIRGDTGAGVIAEILIDRRLTTTAVAEVRATSLLGGGAVIAFTDTRDANAPATYLKDDGTAVITGRIASPVDGLTDTLSEAMDTFDRVSHRLDTLMVTWNKVGENIENLTAQRDPADVDAGDATSNIASVLARTESSLVEAAATMAAVRELLEDEQLLEDIRATASNTRSLTDRAQTTLVTLEEQVTTTVDDLRKRVIAVADDLAQTMAAANVVLSKVNEGTGTLGKMVNDPAVYDNLNDAAERLKAVLLEVRLLVEKMESEGLWSSL